MPDVSSWRPDAPGTTKDGVTHDTLTPDVYETADGPVLSDVGRKQVSASHELDITECSCVQMYAHVHWDACMPSSLKTARCK